MNRSDDSRKFAILEQLEHTRFLELLSEDSVLLDFAMQHAKADLVIPKNLPSPEKFMVGSASPIKYLSLVMLLFKINRYIELTPHSHVHLEYVRLHDDRIGVLWSHSRTSPIEDRATEVVKIDLTNGETEGAILLKMDIVPPPLDLQAEWESRESVC